MVASAYVYPPEVLAVVLGLNIIVSAMIILSYFNSAPRVIDSLRVQIHGLIYIALPLTLLVVLRNGTEGMAWIFFLLLIVFAGDTGAFYVGTYFGRHKLSASVSPGKTIEGAVGGFAANILVGGIFKFFLFPHLSWGICIAFFIAIGAAGQLGDLFESALKRMSGVKDSGSILPGHGGILDRIDALLFAVPVVYFFRIYAL